MKNKKLFGISSLVLAAAAITTFASLSISSTSFRSSGESEYTCGHITFSEEVNSPSASTDLTTSAKVETVCSSLAGIKSSEFTLTSFTNANYKAYTTKSPTYSAIKIGGSKAEKYSGSFTLTITGYTVERAIISATGWKGDTNTIKLGINDLEQQTVTNTASDSAYVFSNYAFEDVNSSTLVFKNDTAATGSARVVISKIVLRLVKKTA